MNYVEHLNVFGVEAKEIPCIKGEGEPTETTKGAVGCLYMDETTGDLHKCVASEDGEYTWVNQDSASKEYTDAVVGDIGSALDTLHEYADSLIGGGE